MLSHFCVFVITEEKPDNVLIDSLMKPFQGSKWNWCQIGGRWTGYLTKYDPSKDPNNLEKCKACDGTSIKASVNEKLKDDDQRIEISDLCDKCGGQGRIVKDPTSWVPYEGDSQQIENVSSHKKPSIILYKGEWLDVVPFHEVVAMADPSNWVTVVDCKLE